VVAQYNYDDENMKGRLISHSVLLIFHVCFTNIILLNYLIAILSSTYGKMRISGIFAFKVNLYSYCERYMIAFKDRAYGEMVIHPPPLSFLVAVLLPFSFSRATMEKMAKGVSFAIFWIENIVYIVLFIALEILISPIAFGKIWWKMIDMLKTSAFDGEQDGKRAMCRSCLYLILWFFTGPFIMIWILLLDLINFIVILTHHDGFIRT
jgi:hypothetical protein